MSFQNSSQSSTRVFAQVQSEQQPINQSQSQPTFPYDFMWFFLAIGSVIGLGLLIGRLQDIGYSKAAQYQLPEDNRLVWPNKSCYTYEDAARYSLSSDKMHDMLVPTFEPYRDELMKIYSNLLEDVIFSNKSQYKQRYDVRDRASQVTIINILYDLKIQAVQQLFQQYRISDQKMTMALAQVTNEPRENVIRWKLGS